MSGINADLNDAPKVSLAAILIKDKKVLLGRRKGALGAGTWGFPGGKLEFREGLNACIRREVLEETGIRVRGVRFAALTNDIFKKERKHYVTLFFICKPKSGKARLMEPEKCEGWEWFTWNTMPRPLSLSIRNLVKQGFDPSRKPKADQAAHGVW